jgi:hypothetical protein
MSADGEGFGPLGALRFELRQVLAACASERCSPEVGAKLEAVLNMAQWETAATMRADFYRECGDTDAILRVLGLDPVNCRTDGGSLKLTMILGALEHRDVMTKRAARKAERERCATICDTIRKQYEGDSRGHAAERAANAIRLDQP